MQMQNAASLPPAFLLGPSWLPHWLKICSSCSASHFSSQSMGSQKPHSALYAASGLLTRGQWCESPLRASCMTPLSPNFWRDLTLSPPVSQEREQWFALQKSVQQWWSSSWNSSGWSFSSKCTFSKSLHLPCCSQAPMKQNRSRQAGSWIQDWS